MSALVAAVRVPERTWRSEARAVKTVWRRDLIRFVGSRGQVMTWLIQPLLFLFVLGSGLQSLSTGVDFKTFLFPGMVCVAVFFTAMISAASLVWDRELGFLREMTVAPVSRTSIVLGKCLGGSTIAASQGVIVLALAGLVGVPYEPGVIAGALVLLVLLAFAVNAFGVLVAVSIRQAQTFHWIMQLVVFPMFFLSGALFPVAGLPGWLEVLNRVDPLTYAVDPMRRLMLDVPGVTWFGWRLPALFEVGIVLLLGVAMLALAVRRFSRSD